MAEEQGKEDTVESQGGENLEEGKLRPKIIRVFTVFAYISSVSMAAILLSIYYIFMWDGQPTLARRRDPHMEPIMDYRSDLYQGTPRNTHQDIPSDELANPVLEHILNVEEVAGRNTSYTTSLKTIQGEIRKSENTSNPNATSFNEFHGNYSTTQDIVTGNANTL